MSYKVQIDGGFPATSRNDILSPKKETKKIIGIRTGSPCLAHSRDPRSCIKWGRDADHRISHQGLAPIIIKIEIVSLFDLKINPGNGQRRNYSIAAEHVAQCTTQGLCHGALWVPGTWVTDSQRYLVGRRASHFWGVWASVNQQGTLFR